MNWTRSISLALANSKCTACHGSGITLGRTGSNNACDCVLRGIFKACYNRFRLCAEKEKYMSKVSLEIHSGPKRRGTWGRKDEEYIADFINIARRTLDEKEFQIFRFRFLLGADWKLCCRQLKMDRGTFHHAIYSIQERVGQALAEVKPYALYPVQEYFSGSPRQETVKAFPARENRVTPIRPPVGRPRIIEDPAFDLKAA